MEIAVPDPSLVLLVGAAGAGKTTFASRHFRTDEVMGSDALRARIAGDEADQRVTRTAFSILHRMVERRLATGRLTVVDATNTRRHARRALLVRGRAAGVPVVAIVLDLPPGEVQRRNAARPGRVVGSEIVARQLDDLAAALGPGVLEAEGFAAVHRLRAQAELDAVRIRRVARR
ncbi:MAG TPA: AAA family ATPase [Candidatus Limnocylindrales bacterium]|jgi:protein phosphatase